MKQKGDVQSQKAKRADSRGGGGTGRLRRNRAAAVCAAGGLLLGGLLAWREGDGKLLAEVPNLERGNYGETLKEYRLWVGGLKEREEELELALYAQEYTEQEAYEQYEQVMQELETGILGINSSLQEVRADLELPTRIAGRGIRLRWSSEQPDIVSSTGEVQNQNIGEEGTEVYLHVTMTDGRYFAEYLMRIRVLPPLLSEEEQLTQSFVHFLREREMEARTEKKFLLPVEFEGRKLSYRMETDKSYRFLPLLGLMLGILLYVNAGEKEEKQRKVRERELLLDYSEVLSKLMIFLGAGMTVRLSMERMASDYERGVSAGKRLKRPAYEELAYVCKRMQNGLPEGEAYREYGERCGISCYRKLSTLLEQNRKTGNKHLREMMRTEMADALEQRKSLARRLGEEAGTKLLFPLLLLLGVVMVLVMIPAMMAMG